MIFFPGFVSNRAIRSIKIRSLSSRIFIGDNLVYIRYNFSINCIICICLLNFIKKKNQYIMMNSVPGDQELPLEEHIKELRSRMLVVVIPITLITAVVFIYSGILLKLIWNNAIPVPMTVYSPMELILTRFKLSLVAALFIGIPLLVYEGFMFTAKGLYKNEKMFFIKIVPFSFILFLFGAILAYFVVLPILFKYTIFYSNDVADPQVSVIKTIDTIITLILGFGLVFQFPLLLVSAIKMGLLKRDFIKGKRKFIYGALIAFAFFITPDPTAISELIVALVLVMLFEFSLVIARYF
ncbi:MAG: twin-arginine translocase subunit TatC [Candidatus Methanoperedens sp.]|nr:twin-arginine translocase subunit TatC [Candidatus Methanoperedens sp.]